MTSERAQKKGTTGLRGLRFGADIFLTAIAVLLLCPVSAFSSGSSSSDGNDPKHGGDLLEKPIRMPGTAGESSTGTPFVANKRLLAPPTSWGVRKIGADSVWARGVGGAGVVIAILDTGVRYTHKDLASHLWTNTDEIPNNGVDDDSNGYVDDYIGYDFANDDGDPKDDNGHGTFIAGVVLGDGTAGFNTGVAPEAMLMSLKVYDSLACSYPRTVFPAIEYAVHNGADIICFAWGWADRPDLLREVWRAYCYQTACAGRIIVAMSDVGIGEIPHRVLMPANVPPPWLHPDQKLRGRPAGAIAVGATDSFDVYDGAQIGPTEWPDFPYVPGNPDSAGLIKPDLSAPGYYITSIDWLTDSTYRGGMYGSTMACAHVAGAAALLLSVCPSFTPAEIDSFLEMTAVDRGDPGKDNFYGAGRLDVWAAYRYCLPGIEERDHGKTPDRVLRPGSLECLPNPFSDRVTISYALESREPATIRICDQGGRVRYEIPLGVPASNQGAVQWNGRDSAGCRLSSGVYFVRISAGTVVICKKIILIN